MGSSDKKLDDGASRNYIVSLANQRISARIPKPSDVAGVDQDKNSSSYDDRENQASGNYEGWSGDVIAITNPTNPNV
eukprot:2845420-Karenia_brevis.AAC.1